MYNETVMEHFQNPRNTGDLEGANGIGNVGNPACGDVMKIFVKIADNCIIDIRHKTFGCAAAIACSSAATEMIKGKSVDEAITLTRDQVGEVLNGLPEQKMACSNLAPDAIRAAIEDFRSKENS